MTAQGDYRPEIRLRRSSILSLQPFDYLDLRACAEPTTVFTRIEYVNV